MVNFVSPKYPQSLAVAEILGDQARLLKMPG